MIREEKEEDISTLEESLISFRLSGPNEDLSRYDWSNEEPQSNEDSVMHSSHKEPRTQYTHKEKGKKKMPKYDTDKGAWDRGEFDTNQSEDGPQELRSVSCVFSHTI